MQMASIWLYLLKVAPQESLGRILLFKNTFCLHVRHRRCQLWRCKNDLYNRPSQHRRRDQYNANDLQLLPTKHPPCPLTLQMHLTQKTAHGLHNGLDKWHWVNWYNYFKTTTILQLSASHSSQKPAQQHISNFQAVLPWTDTIFHTLQYHLSSICRNFKTITCSFSVPVPYSHFHS